MKSIVVSLLALLCIVAYTVAHAPEDIVPGVVELTNANFEKYLDGSKPTIVEFYAPWCGHCKNLAPEMHKLGEAVVKARTESVQFAKVDCDAHRDVCSKYGVQGYPTIKYFPAGSTTPEDYTSGRSAEDLVQFMNQKAGSNIRIPKEPSFVVDLTPSNFDKIVMDADKDVLVEFFAPWCGHCKKLTPEYEKAAQALQAEGHVVIAKMDADKYKDIPTRYDVKGFPTLKFFPKGASKSAEEYNGDRTAEGIVSFINKKTGTTRTVAGQLNDDAGLVGALTQVAKKFIAAAADEKNALIAEGEKAIETLAQSSKQHADVYIKTMKKILEKGEDYAEKEFNRLTKILSGSSVASDNVEFASSEEAQKALEFHGRPLLGREIRLDIAQERGERGERPAFTPQSGNFRSGGDGGDEKKIFVKGFDASLSEDDIKNTLREHFSSCGEIKNVSVPIDRDTGNSKGIAYLEFSEGKEKALELNGSDMGGGFYLVVDEPRPRGDSSGGGGFGRGNGRFGSGGGRGRDGGRGRFGSGGGRGRDGGRGRFGSGGGRGSDRGRGRPSFTPQGKKTTFGDE